MNPILQNKLNELESASDYECWYLVKQPTAFDCLCYLVSFLKEYQDNEMSSSLQDHIEKRVLELQKAKPNVEISNNYRALRVAAFFGLITMTSKGYVDALITPTYYEICKRCGMEFERTDTYSDIIDRQIEKMFLSSNIDEGNEGVRKEYRLYPVMLLYKVLIELGRTTGNYKIDLTEYRYLVATTRKFSDFLDTLLLIKVLRDEPTEKSKFEQYRTKFDNRLIQALKQLKTLNVDRDSITLNPERVDEVAQKVFIFESNSETFETDHYLTFLGSTSSLIQLEDKVENVSNDAVGSVEWFAKEATLLGTIDDEAEVLYKEFRERFAPEILKELTGTDILHRIFINETGVKDSLCHYLEYDKRYNLFGSVAGGSAYKYGLFYSHKEQSWMTGSGQKKIKLTEAEAIELGTKIRDQLVVGAEIISQYGALNNIKDYAELQAKLYSAMENTIGKAWVMMYYHMIFPDLFPVFYNEEWQKKVLEKINIDADENSFIRMGQIALFVKQCGISNVAFSKIIHKIDTPAQEQEELKAEEPITECTYDTTKGGAQNKVIYGTPGCGKSFYVQNRYLNDLGVEKENRIRTTFYQDYTNTDFVGQILPKVHEDKTVTYEFNPGPFALALKKAIENPDKAVALIIEELNRGNAASIFGDIFQLLDRDKNGRSQYDITNTNLQDYLNQCFAEQKIVFNNIRIPANLHIVATMNTSDQNVFTLDTAFKRRWQFEKIRNQFTSDHEYKDYYVPGMPDVTWKQLVDAINAFIVNQPDDLTAEDKQLGVYFVTKETLCEKQEECSDKEKMKSFAYKLFEYLWDDVAKFAHSDWFGAEIKTLDQLIDAFVNDGKQVLANVLNQK